MGDKPKDPYAHEPDYARERIRLGIARVKLSSNRLLGYRGSDGKELNDEEELKKLGYTSQAQYWEAELSKPCKVSKYVNLLRGFHFEPFHQDLSVLEIAIRDQFRLAISMRLPWIFRNKLVSTVSSASLDGWMVEPRQATAWLMSLPTERGLVPPGLQRFIEQPTQTVVPASRSVLRRGPRPNVRPRVETEMRRALEHGYDLPGAKQDEMAEKFKASRDTCQKARQQVLGDFAAQNSDK